MPTFGVSRSSASSEPATARLIGYLLGWQPGRSHLLSRWRGQGGTLPPVGGRGDVELSWAITKPCTVWNSPALDRELSLVEWCNSWGRNRFAQRGFRARTLNSLYVNTRPNARGSG